MEKILIFFSSFKSFPITGIFYRSMEETFTRHISRKNRTDLSVTPQLCENHRSINMILKAADYYIIDSDTLC